MDLRFFGAYYSVRRKPCSVRCEISSRPRPNTNGDPKAGIQLDGRKCGTQQIVKMIKNHCLLYATRCSIPSTTYSLAAATPTSDVRTSEQQSHPFLSGQTN